MKIIKIGAVWCPSCIIVNKHFKVLKEKYKDFEFIDLDIDMDEEETKEYNVGNILPVIVIKNKKDEEIKRIIGEVTEEKLLNEIENALN